MKKTLSIAVVLLLVLAVAGNAVAAKSTEERLKALEKKVRELQVANAQDRIDWSGDLRVEAHAITGEVPAHYDGMALQAALVNTMFYHDNESSLPMDMSGLRYDWVNDYIADADNYGAYMNFLNGLDLQTTFPQYMQAMLYDMALAMMMDPMTMTEEDWAMVQDQAMQMLMMNPATGVAREGFKTDNDILYTTRLRLNMKAKVADKIGFTGRLSMYKPWGAATQTGVFNGQANTLNTDANWPGVPGDAKLKVDAAYFSWNDIGETPFYLSLGRRPSTNGPPLHIRHDEMRQGTPMGTIIDFQFDGATLGYKLSDETTLRACYGLGYESQYGQGLVSTDNALEDAQFFGFNIDAWNTEEMQIQTTVARAFDITDGFNGEIIMPVNPVTGMAMPGPIVTRFTPTANLGDFDIASVLLARRDGPLDWFVTGSWSKSHPEDLFGPFGGLFSNPFETPESQTGSMYYVGARYNLPDGKTKLGLEWNKGSEYWFNFAPAQDDLIAPKTSTRGTVFEGYLTHRVARKFVVKLAYISYDYDYSGSGWHVGAPQDLGEQALMGFPTYEKAGKFSLGFSARF